MRQDGRTVTLVRDALGSVRAETNSAGAVTKAFRYAAYGAVEQRLPAAASPTLFGFAGELADPTGLIYLRSRWYDPGTGRFGSADALRGSLRKPQSLNRFAYALCEPTRYADPSGFEPSVPMPQTGPAGDHAARCVVAALAFEQLSTGALVMEQAGLSLLGAGVTIFGATGGTGVPATAGAALAGAVFEVAAVATEGYAVGLFWYLCLRE